MSLSGRVLKELTSELKELERVRDGAIERIAAIQMILTASPSNRGRTSFRRDPSASPTAPALPALSLRATILQTLQSLSGGSAMEVTRHLQREGFRVGGTTSLRERVAHELSRLRRRGVVRRVPGGQYEVAMTDQPVSTSHEALRSEEALAFN